MNGSTVDAFLIGRSNKWRRYLAQEESTQIRKRTVFFLKILQESHRIDTQASICKIGINLAMWKFPSIWDRIKIDIMVAWPINICIHRRRNGGAGAPPPKNCKTTYKWSPNCITFEHPFTSAPPLPVSSSYAIGSTSSLLYNLITCLESVHQSKIIKNAMIFIFFFQNLLKPIPCPSRA